MVALVQRTYVRKRGILPEEPMVRRWESKTGFSANIRPPAVAWDGQPWENPQTVFLRAPNSKGPAVSRAILSAVVMAIATLAIAGAISYSKASMLRGSGQSATASATAQPRGVAIVDHGGYPELQIDG